MNSFSFRDHHVLQLLEGYLPEKSPLDLAIHRYFRANKALGSKDRAVIAESIYTLIRWQALIDYFCHKPICWEKRLAQLRGFNPSEFLHRSEIPLHIRVSFPSSLFDRLLTIYGQERAIDLCLACNRPAPTTVRANLLKISRDELLERWKPEYSVIPCQQAKSGITFLQKLNFFTLPEFKAGLFEVQDEGSQLIAELVAAHPGNHVLDWCCGSGGKSLAIAPLLEGKGHLWLHDIRSSVLIEAKRRLKRAGVQNGQIMGPDDPRLKKLRKKMDWVLADVPCSGTGTLRRNPDMKWKYSDEMVQRLIGQQRTIFEKALSFVRPGGRIMYATCSILKEENQAQVDHFLATYPLKLTAPPFQSLPIEGGMDGFFGAIFQS